jgi:hypothetical protein
MTNIWKELHKFGLNIINSILFELNPLCAIPGTTFPSWSMFAESEFDIIKLVSSAKIIGNSYLLLVEVDHSCKIERIGVRELTPLVLHS